MLASEVGAPSLQDKSKTYAGQGQYAKSGTNMAKCRTCSNAFKPSSSIKYEKEGIDIMVKYGYRNCKAARTPEEKARWITGGCECVYQERYLAKTGMGG